MSASPPPYRLLAIDLDGTLLDSSHRISPENLRAIQRARAAGMQVSICTGRGWIECREYARQINHSAPAIVAGGAIVTCSNTQRTLHRFTIDQPLVHELARCMLDHGHAVLILKDPDSTGRTPADRGHDYVVVSPRGEAGIDPISRWWFKNLNVNIRIVPELELDEHPQHTVRVGICGPRAETQTAAAELRDRFGSRVQFHYFAAVAPGTSASPGAECLIFEAFGPEVNKWNAIRWVAQRQAIDTSQVVAIGNDINDVAMLQHAGLSIAMGNAIPEARAAAQRLTLANDEHGVAHAIDQILAGAW